MPMEIAGYEIERCLAQGATSTAYLATQISLGRPVVLKVLDTALADTPTAVQRFLNEGRLIASLHHPHLITIHDIATSGRYVYLSMEYVEGGDLKQRLAKGPMPVEAALDVIEKIASALGYAHLHGVIHRDVKPGNILFRRNGSPVLTDFGIAKSRTTDGDLTGTGMFLGSPNYMAPEQVDSRTVDLGADIYALGIILYEMLTGQKPFISNSIIDVIYMHKKAPMPRLPARFAPLQGLLDLMCAKSRADRFRDTEALLHYIRVLRDRGVIDQLSAAGSRDVTTEQWLPPAPRQWRKPTVVLLGLLLLVALAYGALFVVERRLAAPAPVVDSGSQLVLPEKDLFPPPLPTAAVATEEVISALAWLGRHSISQLKLTAPPGDNAYHYFSRLRQLAPEHPAVAAGFREIGAAFALMAEREIAMGNEEQARLHIALARQMDPGNEALPLLTELAGEKRGGVWRLLTGWAR
jgi:tRNA A-37 threonylcarbamoyl transferase component Bud32